MVKVTRGYYVRGNGGGSTPAAKLIVEDTFTRANGNLRGSETEVGERRWFTYAEGATDVNIFSNAIRCNSADAGGAFIAMNMLGTDFIVDVNMTNLGGTGNFVVGFGIGPSVYVGIRILATTGAWQIISNTFGTVSVIASGYSASGSIKVTLEREGTTWRAYANDVLRFNVSSSLIPYGQWFVRLQNTLTCLDFRGEEL